MRKNVIDKALQTLGVITLLVACQALDQTSSSSLDAAKNNQVTANSKPKDQAKSENAQAVDQEHPDSDRAKAVENITTSLKEAVTKDSKSRQLIQKILAQPQKINQFLEACSSKVSGRKKYSTDMRFAGLFWVSDEKAILYISCYLGAYQGGGVPFLVSKTYGMQSQPLALTKLVGYGSGKLKEVEILELDNKSKAGYFSFNERTKQFSLLHRCDGLWSCFSKANYIFENDRFILQEYIVGERKLTGKDIRYTTQRFTRSENGWLSSGLMKCSGTTLKKCTKVGAQ